MNETKINLLMDADKNIKVTNLNNNSNFTISYTDKTVAATNIYQVLNYQLNNTYILDSNIEEITDENDKSYFLDIFTLFKSILDEVNEMVEVETTDDDIQVGEEVTLQFTNDELEF